MKQRKVTPPNLGSARSPIEFGGGTLGYRRNGQWRYRNLATMRKFGSKFVEATDQDLILELERRGYQILYPAHECLDRPNLPCPACDLDAPRAIGAA